MTDFSNPQNSNTHPPQNPPIPQPQNVDPNRPALDYDQPTQITPPAQPQYISHPNPEHAPIVSNTPVETVPIVEVGFDQELEPEVQEFMQRVESDKVSLDQPIVMHGTPIVQPPHWQEPPKAKLPTSKNTIIANVKGKATNSVTWLANWCLRIIKKFNGQVIYTDPEPPTGF